MVGPKWRGRGRTPCQKINHHKQPTFCIRALGGFPDSGTGGTLEVRGSAVAQMFAIRCGARCSCGAHRHRG
eukprot:420316-Pyramimonas_sp.AAC.1